MDTESSGGDTPDMGSRKFDDFSDLLDMHGRIMRGYHTLADETIKTEEMFLEFVNHIEHDVRQSWNTSEFESRRLQTELQSSESEHTNASGIIKNIRQQLTMEMDRRALSEGRVKDLQNILNTLRDMLSGDRTLTDEERQRMYETTEEFRQQDTSSITNKWTGVRTSEDIDRISMDGSDDEILDDDDLEMPRSEPTERVLQSRSSRVIMRNSQGDSSKFMRVSENVDGDIEVIAKTSVRIPENGPISAHTRLSAKPRKSVGFTEPMSSTLNVRRSQSVPRFVEDTDGNRRRRSHEQAVLVSSDVESQVSENGSMAGDYLPRGPPMSQTTNLARRRSKSLGKGLDLRLHKFVEKLVVVSEPCFVCKSKINWGYNRKCTECHKVCHTRCEASAPIPCAPAAINPVGAKSGGHTFDLPKMVSDHRPCVPAVVAQCIRFIESHGMKESPEEGLYRVPGSQSEVNTLKTRFYKEYKKDPRRASIPDLNRTRDVHVVCGFLKKFLMSLKEPLLTIGLWDRFAAASKGANNTEFFNLIDQLPLPNRDTLACLMIHFHRVADTSAVRMPVKNLQTVLLPSVIGYSRRLEDMSDVETYAAQIPQRLIVEKLFSLRRNFWEELQRTLPRSHHTTEAYGVDSSRHDLSFSEISYYEGPEDPMVMEGGSGMRGVGNASFSKMVSNFNFFKTSSATKTTTEMAKDSGAGRGPVKFQSPMMSD